MFEFTESIRVEAPPSEVWNLLSDVEGWRLASNPEHIRLKGRSRNQPIWLGTEIAFEERVAGIKGQAKGRITQWIPGREAKWEGEAVYRHWGIPLRVQEGVAWEVHGDGDVTNLSARVWARFPTGIFGQLVEWYSKSLLEIVAHDREHARRELAYLKHAIESPD